MAGVLRKLGVFMGSRFMPPTDGHSPATWEDEVFIHMNRFIAAGYASNRLRDTFYEDFVVQRDHEHQFVWGVKEPRLSQTFEYLLPYLSDPHVIFMQRPVEDILDSFVRAGYGNRYAAEEWYRMHSVGVCRQLSVYDGPILRIQFDDLISNPKETIQHVVGFIFSGVDRPSDEKIESASETIDAKFVKVDRWPVKVMISTATKGYLHALTASWRLREVQCLMNDPAVGVATNTVVTKRPLMHARNQQVIHFLDSDCTHLFILDSDCVPKDDTIRRLLSYNKPIISAPHESVVNQERGLMVVDPAPSGHGYVQHLPLEGMQGPNVRVGCGGLLIHREVLEVLGPPWFRMTYDERGLLICSEDFDFCERALSSGYEIWAQCDLWQRHI